MTGSDNREAVIRVRGLTNRFGAHVVHEDLDLDVYRGEVLGVVGGSGTGKSVLLRTITGLQRPAAGRIEVFGIDVLGGTEAARETLDDRRIIRRHEIVEHLRTTRRLDAARAENVLVHQRQPVEHACFALRTRGVGPSRVSQRTTPLPCASSTRTPSASARSTKGARPCNT